MDVTENSVMIWPCAAVIMEVPRELCLTMPSVGVCVGRMIGRREEKMYATKALEAAIPTCHAFLPDGQLRGLASSVSHDHEGISAA